MYVYTCVMLLKSAFYCRVVAQPLLKTSWFQLQDENGSSSLKKSLEKEILNMELLILMYLCIYLVI